MKTVLHFVAWWFFVIATIGFFLIPFDFQPLFGSKLTYEQVIAFALISIAASNYLKLLIDEEIRIEKKNRK
jgi:hypothetical protein